jgi:hypothetical protein
VDYSPAGRETLDAVAEELAGRAAVSVEVTQSAAGSELTSAPQKTRARQDTRDYADTEPMNATIPSRRAPDYASAPEITVGHGPAGRETLAAINEELLGSPSSERGPARGSDEPDSGITEVLRAPREDRGPEPEPVEIHEMLTFVVKDSKLLSSSQTQRREFVLARLAHRLPVGGVEQIDRIDVTPWTVRGTVVVRVFCRVTSPGASA